MVPEPSAVSDYLQGLIDTAAARGEGDCILPAGRWVLSRPLELRSGIRVRGSSDGRTHLRPRAGVACELAAEANFGLHEIFVTDPAPFVPGTAVHITDQRAGAFYDTVAIVLARHQHRLLIDRPLMHDYSRCFGARASVAFPVIRGEWVVDASAEDLCISGPDANPLPLGGCRGGGVYLRRCDRVQLRNLTIEHYPGDAISMQQCRSTIVSGCVLDKNRGHGLHPGSGSVGLVMERTTCRDNGGYGVFYCIHVQHTLLDTCDIRRNHLGGLSLGGHDSDNLIRGCTIHDNEGPGAAWRPHDRATAAHRIRFETTRFQENGIRSGSAEVVVVGEVEDLLMYRCQITPRPGLATMCVGSGASRIRLAQCLLEGELRDEANAVQSIEDEPEPNTIDVTCFDDGHLEPVKLPEAGRHEL